MAQTTCLTVHRTGLRESGSAVCVHRCRWLARRWKQRLRLTGDTPAPGYCRIFDNTCWLFLADLWVADPVPALDENTPIRVVFQVVVTRTSPAAAPQKASCPRRRAGVAYDERQADAVGNSAPAMQRLRVARSTAASRQPNPERRRAQHAERPESGRRSTNQDRCELSSQQYQHHASTAHFGNGKR